MTPKGVGSNRAAFGARIHSRSLRSETSGQSFGKSAKLAAGEECAHSRTLAIRQPTTIGARADVFITVTREG